MEKTIFAGLSVLGSDESIFSDNAAFTSRDRREIDRGLKIGVRTHRHTGKAGLSNPLATPSGAVITSGGQIAGGLSISLGYTLVDENGGETMISPVATVSTPAALAIPTVAPEAEFQSGSGSLGVDTYTYALTYLDDEGGETPIGPATIIDRPPGFAGGQILLSEIDKEMEEVGATGWRLYRARGGGQYVLLASGELGESEYLDDGSTEPDCDTHPPTEGTNNTNQVNTLKVSIPDDETIEDATFIRLYASLTGDFGESSLLSEYPVSSAGQSDFFSAIELADEQPPDVNRSYGGAPLIDPDTELLDWHWLRPKDKRTELGSGVQGDVRLVLNERRLYAVLDAEGAEDFDDWEPLIAGSGAAGSAAVRVEDSAVIVDPAEIIEFIGSGAADVDVSEPVTGKARVTIFTDPVEPLDVMASGTTVEDADELELVGSGGVLVKPPTEPEPDHARVLIEGDRALLGQEGMGVIVIPVAQKGMARPNRFKQYTWYCKEEPVNLGEFDIWIEAGP